MDEVLGGMRDQLDVCDRVAVDQEQVLASNWALVPGGAIALFPALSVFSQLCRN